MPPNLLPEVLLYRSKTIDQFPAAKGFGGDDEARRHRQSQVLQLEQVQPLVAHIDDADGVVVDLFQAGYDPLGIIVEQQVELVFGEHVGLVKQGVEYPG